MNFTDEQIKDQVHQFIESKKENIINSLKKKEQSKFYNY